VFHHQNRGESRGAVDTGQGVFKVALIHFSKRANHLVWLLARRLSAHSATSASTRPDHLYRSAESEPQMDGGTFSCSSTNFEFSSIFSDSINRLY
jgi:hypothetical protein